MAFQDAIEPVSEGAETDEIPGSVGGRSDADPFSMGWQTERYESIDSDQLNNVLTALVAVTNLL